MPEEINNENFSEKFPEIERVLKEASFVAIDCEFSALNPVQTTSLFDDLPKHYLKLKRNIEQVIPLQIGITAFRFDRTRNRYDCEVFTFYVKPVCFAKISTKFYFQSDTIKFLTLYKFDFNKFAYKGISYINRNQEETIRKYLENEYYDDIYEEELEKLLENNLNAIENWYFNCAPEEHFDFDAILKKYETDHDFLYAVKNRLYSRFKNIHITKEYGKFVAKKLPDNEIIQNSVIDELLSDLLGFSRVFRLLVALKKPIIGHNVLNDLLLMINSFECPLPETYSQFKSLTTALFPTIFDTKLICYEIRDMLPGEKRWNTKNLMELYNYFSVGVGKKLLSSSTVELHDLSEHCEQFHNAGCDSYCTGYIFIKLANFYAVETNSPFTDTFVGLINTLGQWRNCIRVIRGSIPFIRIDGCDPASTRPPWLVLIAKRSKPININEITTILGSFGYVELKRLSLTKRRVLLAADNFGNAKRLLKNFKHSDYEIKKYNPFKHSTPVQMLITGCATLSTVFAIWMVRTCWRK